MANKITFLDNADKQELQTQLDNKVGQKQLNELINTALADRMQLTPEFVNSIQECTDTTKLYVLPDGYIYAYYAGSAEPSYTNVIPQAVGADGVTLFNNGKGYKENMRVSVSGGGFVDATAKGLTCTGCIKIGKTDVIRFKNLNFQYNQYSKYYIAATLDFKSFWTYSTEDAMLAMFNVVVDDDNNITEITLKSDADYYYIFHTPNGVITDESIITINEEIVENTVLSGWQSTGHAFVPADYEDRILELEKHLKGDLDVYGIVDGDNNVVMTGSLIPGTYSLKYQNADGSTTDIGSFKIS